MTKSERKDLGDDSWFTDLSDLARPGSLERAKQSAVDEKAEQLRAKIDFSEIKRAGERAIAAMAETACKGDRENIHLCDWQVEKLCPKRENNSCPKRIREHDAETERFRRGGKSETEILAGHGVPLEIARQIAAGSVREDLPAIQVAMDWWKEKPRPRALMLLGEMDAGKSFAAAWLIWKYGGLMVKAQDIVDAKDEQYRFLRVPTLLVVDDLGFERMDNWDQARIKIASLSCERIDSGLFTVYSGNIEPELIRDRYDKRLADRVKKLGRVETLQSQNLRSL